MRETQINILKTLIERIIIPKYPFLKLKEIDNYYLTNHTTYDVRFITPKKIDASIQQEIDTELKNLFKMAGLDEIERYSRNKLMAWFKTPREKSWSFHSLQNYEH